MGKDGKPLFSQIKKFNLVGTDGYYMVWVEGDQSFILELNEHMKLSVMI